MRKIDPMNVLRFAVILDVILAITFIPSTYILYGLTESAVIVFVFSVITLMLLMFVPFASESDYIFEPF